MALAIQVLEELVRDAKPPLPSSGSARGAVNPRSGKRNVYLDVLRAAAILEVRVLGASFCAAWVLRSAVEKPALRARDWLFARPRQLPAPPRDRAQDAPLS